MKKEETDLIAEGLAYFRRAPGGMVELIDSRTYKVLMTSQDMTTWGTPSKEYHQTPLAFSPLYADLILQAVEEGKSLNQVLSQPGYPTHSTILRWAKAFPAFADRLEMAKKARAELLHERILDHADNLTSGTLNQTEQAGVEKGANLLKWAVEKGNPEKYSSKGQTGGGNVTIVIDTGISRAPVIEVTTSEVKNEES